MSNEILPRVIAHTSLGIYICSLVWLLYALRGMVRNRATQFIYATLCFWLVLAAKDIAYLFGDTWYDLEITNVLMSIDLWLIPIATILLLHTLQPRWLNMCRISWMIFPFFIFTLLNIIFKGDSRIFFLNQIYGFLFASISGVIVFILTFKCDLYINANFSDKKPIDIRWVRIIIIMMYAICTLWFILSMDSTWVGDTIYYISTTILTTLLFNFILNHKEVIFPDFMTLDTIIHPTKESRTSQESSASMHQFTEIEERLEIAIKRDKIYLNPHLSLTDLANHIGTNRTYLSRYINNYKATPFINYINDLRCAEAQQLLKADNSGLSMIEISDRCGFASYSTFRRVFKQKYGCSPSSYQK